MNWTNLQDLVDKITNHCKAMNIEMIISCINKVKSKYWIKVANFECIKKRKFNVLFTYKLFFQSVKNLQI